jgi:DNA primase
VAEGFQVNVAVLPPGDDPDNFIRKAGGAAYQEKLRNSRQYLEYLLDRESAGHDFSKDDSRREFLTAMLTVAARIPDAAARDQFADRLAHKARITEEVVRAEIRKAAVLKQTVVEERTIASLGQVKPVERGLIWAVMRDTSSGMAALARLGDEDFDGLATRGILQQARSLQGWPDASLPQTLVERLNTGEAALVAEICRHPSAPSAAADCVRVLQQLRLDRERAAIKREIGRLQDEGPSADEQKMNALLVKSRELKQQIESLMEAESRS